MWSMQCKSSWSTGKILQSSSSALCSCERSFFIFWFSFHFRRHPPSCLPSIIPPGQKLKWLYLAHSAFSLVNPRVISFHLIHHYLADSWVHSLRSQREKVAGTIGWVSNKYLLKNISHFHSHLDSTGWWGWDHIYR